tara:strand:+ start:49 stop:270 length:222 start_codon:yes stop_codon:yes gene_type:complete
MAEPVDVSKKHFYVSLIKSIWRLAAGGLLSWAGYVLWIANDYTDIFIADCGFFLMLAGAAFIIAEILGIVEEL